jgi:hypothetical protein
VQLTFTHAHDRERSLVDFLGLDLGQARVFLG